MPDDLVDFLLTALVGFFSGLIVCIPVGPINVTLINEGAQRGFKWAFLIGLGATATEVIYCAVSFAGFSGIFHSRFLRATIELVSFLLTLFLGLKYLMMHSLPVSSKTLERVEHRLHPHAAFAIGFVRVLGNPSVLLLWITLSASFIAHHWVENTWISKLTCVGGVTCGALAWYTFLSYLVSHGHRRFSAKTLLRLSQISGAGLLVVSATIGLRIIGLLAHR